jgi:hypothetical protein
LRRRRRADSRRDCIVIAIAVVVVFGRRAHDRDDSNRRAGIGEHLAASLDDGDVERAHEERVAARNGDLYQTVARGV